MVICRLRTIISLDWFVYMHVKYVLRWPQIGLRKLNAFEFGTRFYIHFKVELKGSLSN